MSVDGFLAAADSYSAVVGRVAAQTGAVLVDGAAAVPGDSAHYIDSGHFRDAGSKRMATAVGRALADSAVFRALLAQKRHQLLEDTIG